MAVQITDYRILPWASVSLSTPYAINNDNAEGVQMDTTDNDPWQMADFTNDGTRLVAVVPGVYLVTFDAWFAYNASGFRIVQILKNGLGLNLQVRAYPNLPGTPQWAGCVTGVVPLGVGEYVQGGVYQNRGGTLDVGPARLAAIRLATTSNA